MSRRTLETERLWLRSIEPSDVDALHELWTDPAVREYLWDDVIISRATVEEIVESSEGSFEQLGFGLFALGLRDALDELIGFCGLRTMDDGPETELMYALLPAHWGQGLASEASRRVLRYGFEKCGLTRIVAATDTPNQRSARVMERIGMAFDERRLYKGLDTVFYSISAP